MIHIDKKSSNFKYLLKVFLCDFLVEKILEIFIQHRPNIYGGSMHVPCQNTGSTYICVNIKVFSRA